MKHIFNQLIKIGQKVQNSFLSLVECPHYTVNHYGTTMNRHCKIKTAVVVLNFEHLLPNVYGEMCGEFLGT